jgi:hypothetical protein
MTPLKVAAELTKGLKLKKVEHPKSNAVSFLAMNGRGTLIQVLARPRVCRVYTRDAVSAVALKALKLDEAAHTVMRKGKPAGYGRWGFGFVVTEENIPAARKLIEELIAKAAA